MEQITPQTSEDGILQNVEDLPTDLKDLFIRMSIKDARTAIKEKTALNDLAYMFYRAYTLGASTKQEFFKGEK